MKKTIREKLAEAELYIKILSGEIEQRKASEAESREAIEGHSKLYNEQRAEILSLRETLRNREELLSLLRKENERNARECDRLELMYRRRGVQFDCALKDQETDLRGARNDALFALSLARKANDIIEAKTRAESEDRAERAIFERFNRERASE